MNRYFIIPFSDVNLDKIQAVIFGELYTQRRSLDNKLFVCSLCEGDDNNYEFLKPYTEYNQEAIVKELDNDLWRVKLPF